MITQRDQQVLNFIEQFKIANTSIIQEIFYKNKRVTQRRLQNMIQTTKLKRERYTITEEFIYYFKKPKQLQHDLLLTTFYNELNKLVKIIRFDKEFSKIEGIRPDGFVVYTYNNKNYIAFIEIELSKKGLDIEKYNKLYLNEKYKRYFPVFPKIIFITNQNVITQKNFQAIKISKDLLNIKNILE